MKILEHPSFWWGIAGLSSFLLSVIVFFIAILKKSKRLALLSLIPFSIGVLLGFIAIVLFVFSVTKMS